MTNINNPGRSRPPASEPGKETAKKKKPAPRKKANAKKRKSRSLSIAPLLGTGERAKLVAASEPGKEPAEKKKPAHGKKAKAKKRDRVFVSPNPAEQMIPLRQDRTPKKRSAATDHEIIDSVETTNTPKKINSN